MGVPLRSFSAFGLRGQFDPPTLRAGTRVDWNPLRGTPTKTFDKPDSTVATNIHNTEKETTMTQPIFADRTALVTGGARGIGRAICQMLATHGARVSINYQQNEAAAQQTLDQLQELGATACLAQADVADADQVAAMIETVTAELGPIDLLVNNAGIANSVDHTELDFAAWKRMFAVNVDGPFLTTWAVKDSMVERGFGRIVNISSLAAVALKKDMIHYATTKAAVIAFTRHTAQALAPHNVRVNCVAPGLTNTDLAQSSNPGMIAALVASTPMGRMAEADEIAGVTKFLLSDDSSFVTGQTVVACGGRT